MATGVHVAVVAAVAAQCEHTPGSKGQMPCMCFFNMKELHLPAVLQQQRMSNTGRPASVAVGIQGASCRSCQNALQVVCQLLHCEGVTGQYFGNINQPALLSQQVGSECCTPCQPATSVYIFNTQFQHIDRKGQAKQRPRQHSLWFWLQ